MSGKARRCSAALVALSLVSVANPVLAAPRGGFGGAHRSTYRNSERGISVRYPSSYRVTEGALEHSIGLGYLGPIPMEFAATGGERIVTFEAPADAYSGTDFVNAFLTISENKFMTAAECAVIPRDMVAGSLTPENRKITGIQFTGLDQGDIGLGHQFGGTYLHGFAGNVCYEIGYGIATAGYGAVDGMEKVDEAKVLSELEKILDSIKIRPPYESSAKQSSAAPSIRDFSVTQLPAPQTFSFSWDVDAPAPNEVSISVSCLPDPYGKPDRIYLIASELSSQPFACEENHTLQGSKGSIDLNFRNESGGNANVDVRLFVPGSEAASRTLQVSVTGVPMIFVVTSDGARAGFSGLEGEFAQLYAGRTVQIDGFAYRPDETLVIGETKLQVASDRGNHITFVLPTSILAGKYSMWLQDERGAGNPVAVTVFTPRPQIALNHWKPKITCEGGSAIVPGHNVSVEGFGFLMENTVWIGTTQVTAKGGEGNIGRFYLDFVAPASLAPGDYPFYVENALGKSDVFQVTVGAAQK